MFVGHEKSDIMALLSVIEIFSIYVSDKRDQTLIISRFVIALREASEAEMESIEKINSGKMMV